LANGSARDALSMLEQLAMFSNNDIKYENIKTMFGLIDTNQLIEFINLIINKDSSNIMKYLDLYENNGINLARFAFDIASACVDKLVFLQTHDASLIKKLNISNIDLLNLDVKQSIKMINIWQKSYSQIKLSSEPRFYFELAIFSCFDKLDEFPKNDNQNLQIKEFKSANQSDIQTSKENLPNKVVEVNSPNDQLPPLPDIDGIFNYSQIDEKNIDIDSSNHSEIKMDKQNIKELFMQIAANFSKQKKLEADKILSEIKLVDDLPQILSYLIPSQKVLVASKNGIVLVFDDELDVELLNNNFNNKLFLKELMKFTDNYPLYIIGVSKQTGKE